MLKNKQQKGFTLVEAVVTTAIVALMSALVVVGTNGAREKFQVRNAAQQFASSVRETILVTKNGVNANGCSGSGRACSSYKIVVPAGGDTYDRKIVVGGIDYGKITFALPGGVKFLTSSDSEISFNFLFPVVNASGTLDFALGSKNDTSIRMDVCVTSGGAVSVKSGHAKIWYI